MHSLEVMLHLQALAWQIQCFLPEGSEKGTQFQFLQPKSCSLSLLLIYFMHPPPPLLLRTGEPVLYIPNCWGRHWWTSVHVVCCTPVPLFLSGMFKKKSAHLVTCTFLSHKLFQNSENRECHLTSLQQILSISWWGYLRSGRINHIPLYPRRNVEINQSWFLIGDPFKSACLLCEACSYEMWPSFEWKVPVHVDRDYLHLRRCLAKTADPINLNEDADNRHPCCTDTRRIHTDRPERDWHFTHLLKMWIYGTLVLVIAYFDEQSSFRYYP